MTNCILTVRIYRCGARQDVDDVHTILQQKNTDTLRKNGEYRCLQLRFSRLRHPKSITTAIGMGVSEELGGIVTITVAVIIITGVFGNMMAEFVCKVFRIQEPVAKGIAIGSAAHAVGTAKAMEMGDIEGAMSSLSIAVAGLMTVVAAPLFAGIL